MTRFVPRPRAPWRKARALPTEIPVRDGLHVDWHCHSQWSDGRGTIAQLVEQAESRGVTLGISDHGLTDNARLRTPEQLDAYLTDLGTAPVLRGIEISLGELGAAAAQLPLAEEDASDEAGQTGAAQKQPSESGGLLDRFDYVIASLHAVRVSEGPVHSSRYLNWRAGLYPAYRPSLKRYDRRGYFTVVLDALEATAERFPVTILGHFCLIPELATQDGRARAQRDDEDPAADSEALEWLDAIVEVCVKRDIAIEMNSKSRAPHAGFIRRAHELGARFSLGSDAHQRHRAGDLSYGRRLMELLEIPPDRLIGVRDLPLKRDTPR